MLLPYLSGERRESFDAWLERTLGRFIPPLNARELNRGVKALSTLYVERRGEGKLAERSVDGLGKRGALATYYAALHFITVHHAAAMLRSEGLAEAGASPRQIIDLGCGTGAVGAALALGFPRHPRVTGVDRSGWALDEAAETWASFGLEGRAIRGEIPLAAPRAGRGDLVCAGWAISELDAVDRGRTFRYLTSALNRGASIFVAEPLSGRIIPWWSEWEEEFTSRGAESEMIRVAIIRPLFIEDVDKATGLDHQVIGARVIAGRTVRQVRAE